MQTTHSENALRISHALAALRQTKSQCRHCLLSQCTSIQPECIPCTSHQLGRSGSSLTSRERSSALLSCIVCSTASHVTYRNHSQQITFQGPGRQWAVTLCLTKKTANWFKGAPLAWAEKTIPCCQRVGVIVLMRWDRLCDKESKVFLSGEEWWVHWPLHRTSISGCSPPTWQNSQLCF